MEFRKKFPANILGLDTKKLDSEIHKLLKEQHGSYWQARTNLGYPTSTGYPGHSTVVSGGSFGKSRALAEASAAIASAGTSLTDFTKAIQSIMGLPPGAFSIGKPATPAPILPFKERESPVRAWKRVSLQKNLVSGDAQMLSRHSSEVFSSALSPSVCLASAQHPNPPVPICTCGFYGYKDIAFEDSYNFSRYHVEPWAEVDFYGKVIEHEKGYKAQAQQIIRIHCVRSIFKTIDGEDMSLDPDVTCWQYHWDSNGDISTIHNLEVQMFQDPQTLARQIGVPVVIDGVEYK